MQGAALETLVLAVVHYTAQAVEAVRRLVAMVSQEEHGEVIPLAAAEEAEKGRMEVLAHPAGLVLVMEEAVVVQVEIVQEVQVEYLAVEVEQAQEILAVTAEQAEQAEKERCVYGPGNSEYSRAIWSGCAKA